MGKIKGDEPAMPESCSAGGYRANVYSGLTIRQHFAAVAMQGMLANSIDKQQGAEPFWHMSQENLAMVAVGYADALIAELNKESEVQNG